MEAAQMPEDDRTDTEQRVSTADLAGVPAAEEDQPTEGSRDRTEATGDEARPAGIAGDGDDDRGPLLADQDASAFRDRWALVQVGFVDQPRDAVRAADQLVAELMQRLAQSFSEARSGLERRWDGGGDVSTEDLRVALQRYRSFFNRLLEV